MVDGAADIGESAILRWCEIACQDQFRRQLETIANARLKVVELQHMRANKRSIALTFDGATRSFQEIALPMLARYGYPATLFVSSGHCKHGGRYLGWEELRAIAHDGIEIGGQGVTLTDLSRTGTVRVAAEMDECADEISNRLGSMVQAFAYPFGRFDNRVRELAARRYRLAVAASPGFTNESVDRFAMPRINVDSMPSLFWLANLQTDAGQHWVSTMRIANALASRFGL